MTSLSSNSTRQRIFFWVPWNRELSHTKIKVKFKKIAITVYIDDKPLTYNTTDVCYIVYVYKIYVLVNFTIPYKCTDDFDKFY